jgi:hypothetical protein
MKELLGIIALELFEMNRFNRHSRAGSDINECWKANEDNDNKLENLNKVMGKI